MSRSKVAHRKIVTLTIRVKQALKLDGTWQRWFQGDGNVTFTIYVRCLMQMRSLFVSGNKSI